MVHVMYAPNRPYRCTYMTHVIILLLVFIDLALCGTFIYYTIPFMS